MPKCPKCGKELDHLVHTSTEIAVYSFYVDKKGNVDYFTEDRYCIPSEEDGYFCPYCNERLFIDEKDAIKFLKGR